MSIALADASIVINNSPIAIVPNSIKFNEGLGEQNIRAASVGGDSTEQVYAHNVETNFAMIGFDVYNDIETIELMRIWKLGRNTNQIELTGKTPDGRSFSRSFSQAAIVNQYEVPLGADTVTSIEFTSNKAT